MKKALYLSMAVALMALLSGCSKAHQAEALVTGYTRLCIDGVMYLQFATNTIRHADRDSKPVPCSK